MIEQVEQLPPPPSTMPAMPVDPNSSQKAENRKGYAMRTFAVESEGVSIGYGPA